MGDSWTYLKAKARIQLEVETEVTKQRTGCYYCTDLEKEREDGIQNTSGGIGR